MVMMTSLDIFKVTLFLLLGVMEYFGVDSLTINFVAGDQDHWCYVEPLQSFSYAHLRSVRTLEICVAPVMQLQLQLCIFMSSLFQVRSAKIHRNSLRFGRPWPLQPVLTVRRKLVEFFSTRFRELDATSGWHEHTRLWRWMGVRSEWIHEDYCQQGEKIPFPPLPSDKEIHI